MANEVSIKVSTSATAAVADFKRLTDQIHATEMAARKAGTGFTAMGSAAEHSLNRIATRAAQARREIEQMHRASTHTGPTFGRATGGGYSRGGGIGVGGLIGGAVATVGGTVGSAAIAGAYLGYNEARAQAQAESFLQNAVKQTGQAYAAQAAEVAKLRRELGLTTAQATELQAASLRFTNIIGKPGDASKLTRALANALAGAGRSSDEIPERLRQLSTGQDELFDVLGPVKIGSTFAGSPETIYKAYAKEILNVNRELTDLEKTQARYYAVLEAGAATEGAAQARMASSVGQIDALSNAFKDLAGNIVTAAINTEGFRGAMAGAAKAIANAAGGDGGGAGPAAADAYFKYLNPFTALSNAYNITEQQRVMAGRGPRSLGDRFGSLGGSLAGAIGLDAGALGNILTSLGRPEAIRSAEATLARSRYVSSIDSLGPGGSRDPFAWTSVDEQNTAAARGAYGRQRDALRRFSLGSIGGITSAYGSIIGAGDRLAGLSVSGETPQERAARVFSLSGSVAKDAAEAYRLGGYSAADAASMSEAEARRFRIATLGNVAPGELSADQEAAYRDDLKQYQEDQLKQARETLLEAVRMRKALEKLALKLAPEDVAEPEPVVIQLDNRADVIAKFAASTYSSGDSLRSDQ